MFAKSKKAICLPLSLLLMSATTASYVRPFSYISRSEITCKKQLVTYSSESITTLSHIKNDTVASLTFNYEMYQMWKNTEVLTTYHPSYIMMYQVDVYVNNAVQYKGGLFNWLDGNHAGFLDKISISAKFDGISNVTNAYQTPSVDLENNSSGLRFLKGVYPNNSLYSYPSYSYNKQTEYNMISGVDSSRNLPHFIDTPCYYSNSYCLSYVNYINDPSVLSGKYDGRLVTKINAIQSKTSNSITYNQDFNFNNKLTVTLSDSGGVPNISNDTSDNLYSGPCTNGTDDSSPFYFTFYGVYGYESDTQPTKVTIDLYMHTYHGSHTALDTFDSEASKSFIIHL